jgi:hypothetical protein
MISMAMRMTWQRSGTNRWRLAALVVSSGLMFGCNSLTGLEMYAVEAADDERAEAAATSGGEVIDTGGAVGVGDKPEPNLLNCAWPESTDVGVAVGQTVPTGMSWQGYRAGADPNGPPATIDIADFFDCDGSKGVDVIAFDTSQFG